MRLLARLFDENSSALVKRIVDTAADDSVRALAARLLALLTRDEGYVANFFSEGTLNLKQINAHFRSPVGPDAPFLVQVC